MLGKIEFNKWILVQITAGFLLFPGTYTVAADSRRKRSIPDSKLDIIPGLCEEEDGSSSRLCRIMTTILSTVVGMNLMRRMIVKKLVQHESLVFDKLFVLFEIYFIVDWCSSTNNIFSNFKQYLIQLLVVRNHNTIWFENKK